MPNTGPHAASAAPAIGVADSGGQAWQGIHSPTAPRIGRGGPPGEPPTKDPPKRTSAPEFDGRHEFVIARDFQSVLELGSGVLRSIKVTEQGDVPSLTPLPTHGYLVEVKGPLYLEEAAIRLRFRQRDAAAPAFEGVCVDTIELIAGRSLILFLAEREEGNRVYPVSINPEIRDQVMVHVVQELLPPYDEFGAQEH